MSLALYFLPSLCANAVLGDCGAKANVNARTARINRLGFIFFIPTESASIVNISLNRKTLSSDIQAHIGLTARRQNFSFKMKLDTR